VADEGDRAAPAVGPSGEPDPEPAGDPARPDSDGGGDGSKATRDVTLSYDVAELTRCLTFSFSAGELSKYAERWKVFTDRDGTVAEGARTLVRALDGRGKLAQLVTSLRSHKPLVEWPEPTVVQAAPEPPAPEPEEGSSAPETAPDSPTTDGAVVVPGAEPAGAPLVDPFSAPSGAGVAGLGTDEGLWASLDGTTRAVVLGVIFAAGIGLGVLGFWLVGRGDGEPDPPADSAGEASIAGRAATLLRGSVAGITQACEVVEQTDTARNALTMAFRRCAQPEIRPGLPPGPLLPKTTRKPAQPPPARPTPRRPVSHEPACLDRCHRFHVQCKTSECGAEPTSSSKYADYQRCLAGCLAKYSQCRLRCP